MEKMVRWTWLQLKACLRMPGWYVQLLALVVIMLFVQQLQFPKDNNAAVGICSRGGVIAGQTAELLSEKSGQCFDFYRYADAASLQRDVERGVLECGFLFAEDFDAAVEKEQMEKKITYLCAAASPMGLVAQESVYAAFFRIYSRSLATRVEQEVFAEEDAARHELLMERNRHYLSSDSIFQVEMIQRGETVRTEKGTGATGTLPDNAVTKGFAGLLLFLSMYLYYGRRWEHAQTVYRAMGRMDIWLFQLCGQLAAGCVPAALLLVLLVQAYGWGSVGQWSLRLLVLLLVSAVWIVLVGSRVKKYLSYAAGTLVFCVVQAVVCPVFFDLSAYVPAIRAVRLFFPLAYF